MASGITHVSGFNNVGMVPVAKQNLCGKKQHTSELSSGSLMYTIIMSDRIELPRPKTNPCLTLSGRGEGRGGKGGFWCLLLGVYSGIPNLLLFAVHFHVGAYFVWVLINAMILCTESHLHPGIISTLEV